MDDSTKNHPRESQSDSSSSEEEEYDLTRLQRTKASHVDVFLNTSHDIEPEEETTEPWKRDLNQLYVHSDTLQCTLKHRCIPCSYKIIIHRPRGASCQPNQRPERCPRFRPHFDPETNNNNNNGSGHSPLLSNRLTLIVGDGNFSYSLALVRQLHSSTTRTTASDSSTTTSTLIATSHESKDSIIQTYPDGAEILSQLLETAAGSSSDLVHIQVKHEIDATNESHLRSLLPKTNDQNHPGFDLIVWNFPCIRVDQGLDGQNQEMEQNKTLLREFFRSSQSVLKVDGEIHVTHKTKAPFGQWNIVRLAQEAGLVYSHSTVFDRCLVPGYTNKKVLSSDSFPIWDAQTYVFRKTRVSDKILAPFVPLARADVDEIQKHLLSSEIPRPRSLGKFKSKKTHSPPPPKRKKRKRSHRRTTS